MKTSIKKNVMLSQILYLSKVETKNVQNNTIILFTESQ